MSRAELRAVVGPGHDVEVDAHAGDADPGVLHELHVQPPLAVEEGGHLRRDAQVRRGVLQRVVALGPETADITSIVS